MMAELEKFFRLTADGRVEWNIGRAFILDSCEQRELTMKVVYTGLKTSSTSLRRRRSSPRASRSLAQKHRWRGDGPHGAVIDAEVSSNRPDASRTTVSPAKSARFTSCL